MFGGNNLISFLLLMKDKEKEEELSKQDNYGKQ
jgi:hypothetical protein